MTESNNIEAYVFEELNPDPDDDSRSVHDAVNKIYREVMGLSTPINAKNRPSQSDIVDAIKSGVSNYECNEIIMSLKITPQANLWPHQDKPNPDFIGRMWYAIQGAITDEEVAFLPGKSDNMSETAIISQVSVPLTPNENNVNNNKHASKVVENDLTPKVVHNGIVDGMMTMDYLLDTSNKILMENEKWFQLIQDQGDDLSTRTKKTNPRCAYTVEDEVTKKKIAYKSIYSLAISLWDLMIDHKDTFTKLAKNKSVCVQRICKWIIDNRDMKSISDINDHNIRDIVSQPEYDKNRIYLCKQETIVRKMYNLWCPLGADGHETAQNDILRIYGIVLSNRNRDDAGIILSGKQLDRATLDNPDKKKNVIFDKFVKDFNDLNFKLTNPKDFTKIPGFQDLDPNEKKRIIIRRDRKWFQKEFSNVLKSYKVCLHNYTSETGSGPGWPESFMNWKTRPDELFYNFHKTRGSLMTWIYMRDREEKMLLTASNEPLPEGAQIEGVGGNSKSFGRCKSPTGDVIKNLAVTMTNYIHDKKKQETSSSESIIRQMTAVHELIKLEDTLQTSEREKEHRKRKLNEVLNNLYDKMGNEKTATVLNMSD